MITNPEKLKGKLVEKGLIQEDLAKAIGMNRSTLNRKIQTGEDFSIKDANQIALILNLSKEEALAIFFARYVA